MALVRPRGFEDPRKRRGNVKISCGHGRAQLRRGMIARQGSLVVWCGVEEGARRRNRNPTDERTGGRGRIVWEALPKCKASQRHAPAAGLLHRRVAHIHGTTALTMVSDRTAPPALPLLCSSSCSSRARLHDEPARVSSGSPAIDMRCRRRPRLGMGWLRSVLSPLRKLWCRVNAVQRKSTSVAQSVTTTRSAPLFRFSGF